jgi:hypothetical protein
MLDAGSVFRLLLAVATVAALVQTWRLRLLRDASRADQGAAARETARRSAALARTARATTGEEDAVDLLRRAGYAVLGHQVEAAWTLFADGEPVTFGLRADYLVTRGARRYVAEVKTGRLAPQLSHGPTRRQLLEYGAAFEVHGVLLVDAEARSITLVESDLFERSAPRRSNGGLSRMAFIAAVFAAGVALGAAIMTLQGCAPARPPAVPDVDHYANDSAWLCLPGRNDSCARDLPVTAVRPDGQHVPEAEPRSPEDPPADCFYVYPTVDMRPIPGNHESFSDLAPIIGATDAQAVRFRQVCALFVPLYRQATIGSYVVGGDELARREAIANSSTPAPSCAPTSSSRSRSAATSRCPRGRRWARRSSTSPLHGPCSEGLRRCLSFPRRRRRNRAGAERAPPGERDRVREPG